MEKMTYEKAISRLEEIVALMEKNDLTLDESIKLYDEGTRLTAYCSELLNNARQKITELTKE